jgi:hypothetical protein
MNSDYSYKTNFMLNITIGLIENNTLKSLNLLSTKIRDNGINYLINALGKNSTLTQLEINSEKKI